MVEYYFNPEENRVNTADGEKIERYGAVFAMLDNDAAREWRKENFNTAQNLGELLLTKDFPYKKGDFALQPATEFDRERSVAVVRTAVEALNQAAGKPVALKVKTLKRLYITGLGHSEDAYWEYGHRFTDFADLKQAAGSLPGYERGRFDHWTTKRIRYEASKIDAKVDGRPRERHYKAEAARGRFPSPETAMRLIGGYSVINEKLGYVDVPSMDKEDYIEFGRCVMDKNGRNKFLTITFRILASRDRSPTDDAIREKFDSFDKYREEVERRIADRHERLKRFRQQVAAGQLPDYYAKCSDESLLQRCTRIEFIDQLAPWLNKKIKEKIANCRKTSDFASLFAGYVEPFDRELTAGYIEREVDHSKLRCYINPNPAYYSNYLSVSDDEIAEARERKRLGRSLASTEQELLSV